jgi:hypothetical protein
MATNYNDYSSHSNLKITLDDFLMINNSERQTITTKEGLDTYLGYKIELAQYIRQSMKNSISFSFAVNLIILADHIKLLIPQITQTALEDGGVMSVYMLFHTLIHNIIVENCQIKILRSNYADNDSGDVYLSVEVVKLQ